MLALMQARVVQAPQFRALRLRIPLAEFVAEREDALFRTGLLFVAARAADQRGDSRARSMVSSSVTACAALRESVSRRSRTVPRLIESST